jgi:hypothetical protein
LLGHIPENGTTERAKAAAISKSETEQLAIFNMTDSKLSLD